MIIGIDYGKGDKSTTLTIVNPKYIEELEQENKQLKSKIKSKIKDLKENDNGDDYSVENVVNILKDLLGGKE